MKKFGYICVKEIKEWLDGVIDFVELEEELSKSVWYSDKKEWDSVYDVNGDVWVFDCMIYVKFKEGELMNVLNCSKEDLKKLFEE